MRTATRFDKLTVLSEADGRAVPTGPKKILPATTSGAGRRSAFEKIIHQINNIGDSDLGVTVSIAR